MNTSSSFRAIMRRSHLAVVGVLIAPLILFPICVFADGAIPSSREAAKNTAAQTGDGLSIVKSVVDPAMAASEAAGRFSASKNIADGNVPQAAGQLGQAKTIKKAAGIMGASLDAAAVGAKCTAGLSECGTALGEKGVELVGGRLEEAAIRGYSVWRGGAAVLSTGGAVIAVSAAGIAGDVAGEYINKNAKEYAPANKWLKGRNVNDAMLDDVYFPVYEKASNYLNHGSPDGLLDEAVIEQAKAEGRAKKRARELGFDGVKSANAAAHEQSLKAQAASGNTSQQASDGSGEFIGALLTGIAQYQQVKLQNSSAMPPTAAATASQSCNKTYSTPDGCHPGHDENSHPGGCRC